MKMLHYHAPYGIINSWVQLFKLSIYRIHLIYIKKISSQQISSSFIFRAKYHWSSKLSPTNLQPIWLFDVLRSNLRDYSKIKLSGPSKIIPTLIPSWFFSPTTYNVHHRSSISNGGCNSLRKSIRPWSVLLFHT